MATEIIELTKEEIAEKSQKLASTIAEHDQVDAERKEVAKEFKKQIETLNHNIRELSNVVRSGKEYRQAKGLFEQDFVSDDKDFS